MNWENLTTSSLVEALGWTLVHSIWQISLVALVLFAILRLFKNLSANARYSLAVLALCLACALPVATFFQTSNSRSRNQSIDKLYDTESQSLAKNKAQSPVIISPSSFDNQQTADVSNEQGSFSFEELKRGFNQNLAFALPIIVLFWIFGMGIFTLRIFGGFWHLHAIKTRGIISPEFEWQKRFSVLCEKMEIARVVRLVQSNLVKTPMVVGWFKPLILVPAGIFLQMNPSELETILAHELIHIRRCDNLVNFVQSFIEILFFYHPCVWWISNVIRREREFACDDAVLEALREPHIVYANALANLEEIRRVTKQTAVPLAVAASGGKLVKRIERILYKNAERQNPKQSLWLAGLALLLISTVSISVFSTGSTPVVNPPNQQRSGDRKIAIGFVSIPPVDRSNDPPKDSDATARLMIAKLTQYKIPAIGFVQGAMISDGEKMNPVRANIVRMWRDAGFEIGIGGYKHIWFYDTPYQDYVANAEKNERIVKQILAEKNLPLRYFSYPFLNTGKTTEDKTRFEAWLKEQGLRSIPYTVDNQEWMYSYAYDLARKDNDVNQMKQIQAEFLEYMAKMLEHYETYSQQMFGRDIAQTMVLSPSRLVADSSDAFFGMIQKRGYKFVSMDEALQDAAYQTPETFSNHKSGISWFERWQLTQGKKLLDEPMVDADVAKIWSEKKPS